MGGDIICRFGRPMDIGNDDSNDFPFLLAVIGFLLIYLFVM